MPGAAETGGARALAAAVAGNALEFYDFLCYTYFAVYIGRAFFPAANATTSLLLSLATFGVGFVTRPLGSLLIGAYADRAGRRPALTLTIVLMAAGTLTLAVTPTYAAIGAVAPVILVLGRLMQGFALGGEFGAATAFLFEAAPAARQGRTTSWQSMSQGFGVLASGVMGVALTAGLGADALAAWGWRVPFFVGLLIVPVGFVIRRQLPETLATPRARASGAILRELWSRHRRPLVLTVLVVMSPTIAAYVSNYMATYALTTLGMPPLDSMWSALAHGTSFIAGGLLGGTLCDRYGARRVMVVARVLLMALILPLFLVLVRARTPAVLIAVTGLLSFLNLAGTAAAIAAIARAFPNAVRGAGVAIGYGFSVSLFGGTAQFIVAWLIHALDDPLAPAYYLLATSLVSIWAMVQITAAAPLPGGAASAAA
jgi:MFS family permease